MDIIEKLPNDIKQHISKFIFLSCENCNNKYLKNELSKCNVCNKYYCKNHIIIPTLCNDCLNNDFLEYRNKRCLYRYCFLD